MKKARRPLLKGYRCDVWITLKYDHPKDVKVVNLISEVGNLNLIFSLLTRKPFIKRYTSWNPTPDHSTVLSCEFQRSVLNQAERNHKHPVECRLLSVLNYKGLKVITMWIHSRLYLSIVIWHSLKYPGIFWKKWLSCLSSVNHPPPQREYL